MLTIEHVPMRGGELIVQRDVTWMTLDRSFQARNERGELHGTYHTLVEVTHATLWRC